MERPETRFDISIINCINVKKATSLGRFGDVLRLRLNKIIAGKPKLRMRYAMVQRNY